MHPLAQIGLIVATVGAGVAGLANLIGAPPLAGLGVMLILAGAFNAIIGTIAGKTAKRKKRPDGDA